MSCVLRSRLALQPEQPKADDGQEDVGIEHDAGVARRHVARCHDVMDMPDGGAPLKHRGPEDRSEADAAVALEGEETDCRKAEARVADLCLERAK